MMQLVPYLRFNGNCREAMNFYKDCLSAEIKLQTVGESPMAAQMPLESHNNILHSSLMKDNITILFASDMTDPEGIKSGNDFSLCITCSQDEIKELFSKFSVGSKVTQELKEEFFGTYGELTDKFGMSWMFQANKPQA